MSSMTDQLTCPLCGETDFDRAGFIGHLDQWCYEAAKAREEWAELRREHNAAVLRMQSRQMNDEDREEREREEMRLDEREDD